VCACTCASMISNPPVTIFWSDNVRLIPVCLVDHILNVFQGQNLLEGQLLDGVLELDLKHVQDALTT